MEANELTWNVFFNNLSFYDWVWLWNSLYEYKSRSNVMICRFWSKSCANQLKTLTYGRSTGYGCGTGTFFSTTWCCTTGYGYNQTLFQMLANILKYSFAYFEVLWISWLEFYVRLWQDLLVVLALDGQHVSQLRLGKAKIRF